MTRVIFVFHFRSRVVLKRVMSGAITQSSLDRIKEVIIDSWAKPNGGYVMVGTHYVNTHELQSFEIREARLYERLFY
jgi:hypothetical protein